MADLAIGPGYARFILRGGPDAVAVSGPALGFDLPQEPCRAARGENYHALWLGPDEWLVLAPLDQAEILAAALETAMGGNPHAVVEVTARQIAFILTGEDAAEVLNVGCPLDLDIAAFPVGMCTRTILAKAEIVLWRINKATFHLEVWRSFSAYVREILLTGGAREI